MRAASRSTAALVLLCCLELAWTAGAARARQRHSQKQAAADRADAEAALEKVFSTSGNDRAALIRSLQQYLLEFPNAPRKVDVYRALVDACQHLGDDACALNYAERLVAVQPDDSDMMLIAVTYLQRKGDDDSLARASDYVTRVIDRVEKSLPGERPPGESIDEWGTRRQNLRGVLYFLRGKISYARQNYDSAAKDLETSYEIRPGAGTAELLGEIAELQGDRQKAVEEYTLAFVLPDPGPEGKADRRDIRERLGNVWRSLHGSDQGLGDEILGAYDRASSIPEISGDPADRDARSVFAFTLRRLDGTPMALSTLKGNVLVVSFWSTWCVPCTQINAQFDELAVAWSGQRGVTFLMADADDGDTGVPAFAQKQKWHAPVVYADGLDRFLKIKALPAAVVIAPDGRVVYRVEYPAALGFAGPVSSAIQQALPAAH